MPTIRPSPEGYIVEILRYRGENYQRKWKQGYFDFDYRKKIPVNENGEVICQVNNFWSKSEEFDVTIIGVNGEVDIAPKIDTKSQEFRENHQTLMYLIVGGFEKVSTPDEHFEKMFHGIMNKS